MNGIVTSARVNGNVFAAVDNGIICCRAADNSIIDSVINAKSSYNGIAGIFGC